MKPSRWLALSVLALWSCAATPLSSPSGADLRSLTATRLERFESEAAFNDYLDRLHAIARAQHVWWAVDAPHSASGVGALAGAEADAEAPPPPPPSLSAAPTPSPMSAIVVSGSRISANPAITNVQTRGVDEGDIVKQVGRFLVVLQDGRLFSIDLNPRRGGLAFVDRVNVYRDARTESWYDEMLVYRNRVVVTGYSYVRGASEVTVFSMNTAGRLTREAVYYMSSNDYYDPENYATRLVDDNLVIYAPLSLAQRFANNRVSWPVIRRWIRGDDSHMVLSKGEPLLDPREIYRPVQPTLEPVIHSISVCPLGSPRRGDELSCTSTAFIGPPNRQFYIAPDAAYLWVTGNDAAAAGADLCDAAVANRLGNAATGALFRAPFGGGAPGVIGVAGAPRNQFALASTASEFRALLFWNDATCGGQERLTLKYFSTPLAALGNSFAQATGERYIAVPPVEAGMYENRFTDAYLVYGSRQDYSSTPPGDGDALPARSQIVAVPLANPRAAATLAAPHNIIRAERLGPSNILLTGYADRHGLSLSVLDLTGAPRFSTTATLAGRFESEGRSHAFNSRIDDDDTGLLALPTVHALKQSGRWVWNSTASDLTYLSLDKAGLHPLGQLRAHPNSVARSYHCQVSCVDWYGNSRPIFTGGRIFGLSATELIEGRIQGGRIVEVQRVNLTRTPARH
jgi:hypothetical protein